MGARTNFHFKTAEGELTLYSHWGGDSKNLDLAMALQKARPRLSMGDTGYALRIVISQLINSDWDSETGFGIYVGPEGGEEQYNYTMVDFTNHTVTDADTVNSIEDYIKYYAGAREEGSLLV
jgi:hypothetical protein